MNLFSIFIISSSLIILNLFLLVSYNLGLFLDQHASRDMLVYLEVGAQDKDVKKYKTDIKNKVKDVEKINYVSQKQAFEKFQRELGKDKQLVDGLSTDILPAYFEIKFSKKRKFTSDFVQSIENLAFVNSISYGKKAYDKVKKIRDVSDSLSFYIVIFIIIITVFTIYTTVKLNIYSRKDEIETLELVGATQEFIILPFYIEGILQGVLSSSLAILTLYGIYSFSLSSMTELLPVHMVAFHFLPFTYIFLTIFITSLLGFISSHISVIKFLKI